MGIKTKVNTIYVDVRATRAGNGQVHFDSYWRLRGSTAGVWNSGPIDLPHGPDHYELIFDLDDKSGRHLTFFGNPDDAMYVRRDVCPASKGSGGGEIQFLSVDPNRKKMTVKDLNRQLCTLKYMLRFNGDPVGQCPPYKYDPIISNGGGGDPP